MAEQFYAIKGASTRTTGHYRRPGTRTLYCGRPAGGRNGEFASLPAWSVCTRCAAVKAAEEQPDGEQTVADYQRADADKMPTHPAGQQAAIEGMLAAREHADRPRPSVDDLLGRARLDLSRDVPAEPPTTPATATDRLAADMLALFSKYEREQAAARAARGDTNPYDLDEFEPVRDLADYYAKHRDDPERLEPFLDQLAADLDLADIRALRLAGEAVVAATSRAIKAARDRGMKPPRIADMLGLTPSRVYQVLRELDAEQGEQPPADGDQ
ncbi:hypothetical protein ACFV28_13400 [Streptomyces sp. NPDC059720]|uniref:hypothetical protein n=1 Tax=Streptomyces sp. NPDC059720 TaxID=3346924 RepID=UPI0036B3EA37